ncbi:U11/U12 small nuclear ribonucleoprotein 35 kDa protein-like [Gigantopelta aegis]|uniref:U11/U12 small nuclear ribonucleoprotein 35 kDa protein-like n=1 Tax=Gigantopelta aegis TaxID=1735272 RepID=UPI001B88B3A1|nr:U11/U12 small nuclear ribonucleoprotein 35 kDa protein-like [Gigantopelta aegis]
MVTWFCIRNSLNLTMVFTGIPIVYDPLKAGSIDGTDTDPHDHGIFRAMNAKYKPNKFVIGNSEATIFVTRLNRAKTTEETLEKAFNKFGKIKRIRLVRNVVTRFSQGYAFIEFEDTKSAFYASRDGNNMVVDDFEVFVDMECERTLKGWIPRRMGGGFGGKKESGQLRFGCKDRPFRRPLIVGENKEGFNRKPRTPYSDNDHEDYRKREWDEESSRRDYEESSRRDYDRKSDYRKRRRSRSRSSSRSRKRDRDSSREDYRRRHRD